MKDAIPIPPNKNWIVFIIGHEGTKVHKSLFLPWECSLKQWSLTLLVMNGNQILPFIIWPYDALTYMLESPWCCKVQRSVTFLIFPFQSLHHVVVYHWFHKTINNNFVAFTHCHVECSASACVDHYLAKHTLILTHMNNIIPISLHYWPVKIFTFKVFWIIIMEKLIFVLLVNWNITN